MFSLDCGGKEGGEGLVRLESVSVHRNPAFCWKCKVSPIELIKLYGFVFHMTLRKGRRWDVVASGTTFSVEGS